MSHSLSTITRFLAGGAFNTGSTFVLYWFLLFFFEYQIAYATSFVAGILLSYVINTKLVFRTNHSLRKLVLFPLVYLCTYFAGAVVLGTAVTRYNIDARIAPLISICATLPLSYLLTKLVLSGVGKRPRRR